MNTRRKKNKAEKVNIKYYGVILKFYIEDLGKISLRN